MHVLTCNFPIEARLFQRPLLRLMLACAVARVRRTTLPLIVSPPSAARIVKIPSIALLRIRRTAFPSTSAAETTAVMATYTRCAARSVVQGLAAGRALGGFAPPAGAGQVAVKVLEIAASETIAG